MFCHTCVSVCDVNAFAPKSNESQSVESNFFTSTYKWIDYGIEFVLMSKRGQPVLSLRFSSLQNPPVLNNRVYTLSNDISAMQILQFDEKDMRLSPVSRLPRGAQIEACGNGFDEQTLKVCFEGQFYFVFVQDLETQRKAAAAMS